jgi:hypothetical protein
MSSSRPTSSPLPSRRSTSSRVAFAAAALVAAASCSSPHGGPAQPTSVVVGVTSDDTGGVIGSIHVATTIDGQSGPEVFTTPSALPKEVSLAAPAADPTAKISVRADAYQDPAWDPSKTSEQPVLTRTAETSFVPGQSLLLRLHLQSQCLLPIPGTAFAGPTCTSPQTCLMGTCGSDVILTTNLEQYRSDWAVDTPDVCKPAGGGAPQVIVGSGQTDYLPITTGETLTPELGPQGGHHVWVAVRMKGLKQSGSVTTLSAVQPGTGAMVLTASYVFTFDQDEGGYCKLYGLRYQLDNGGVDYHQFLGKPLDITATVTDQTGTSGTGVAHVNIDTQVLCPTTGMPCPTP